jgi:glycosyltransferase involved in cell wall biosynthesis
MAMGIPVVATPQVAKGVQASPGRHLLVGSTPEESVGHIVELLGNPALRMKMAEAGRQQVVHAHSWTESMKLLDQIIEERGTANDRQETGAIVA